MSAITRQLHEASAWQRELARAYTRVPDLLRDLGLDAELARLPPAILEKFPLKVPRGFAGRMRHGDPADPLLRQVLPLNAEAEPAIGFVPDPVGDLESLRGPGLLQKYEGRALIVATGACAVHCRYCFRREFPYQAQQGVGDRMPAILERVRSDQTLTEIILSGGDPLSLSNPRLVRWIEQLGRIEHLSRLRIHTRLPIVLPERVDDELLDLLARCPKKLVLVLHVNHPREIDTRVTEAVGALGRSGAALLNQSVLLRGVNDEVSTLVALSERLFEAGVLPYYLHQLDRVSGAAHFSVEDSRAQALIESVAGRLPGYLVPRLVRELAGEASKTPLTGRHNSRPPHNQKLVT